jgi:hypothetical protein
LVKNALKKKKRADVDEKQIRTIKIRRKGVERFKPRLFLFIVDKQLKIIKINKIFPKSGIK